MEAQILHHQRTTHNDKQNRKIQIGCYSGISGLSHDEYVTIENNNVVWSCGSRIIKSFELTPSITPNTDIPMTLRSATTMNVDTPVNYFRDNQYAMKKHSIYDVVPFVNDHISHLQSGMQSLSQHTLKSHEKSNKSNSNHNNINMISLNTNRLKQNPPIIRRENNENVNTDNCYRIPSSIHETDTDTTNTDKSDDAMSVEENEEKECIPQHTPPLMIKPDSVLCDDAMDIEHEFHTTLSRTSSFSGLTQVMDGINIKTPKKHKKRQKRIQNILNDKQEALNDINDIKQDAHSDLFKDNDTSKVIDVIWCYFPHFPSNEPQRCLCLLQNENITIISLSGDIYYVPLPCETQSIWSLPEGLMIQAKTQKDTRYNDNHYPILFSLLNPLEELRPIALHLLNANSKSLFFDEYYDKVAAKLQSNINSKTSSNPISEHLRNKHNKTGFESPKKRMQMFGHKAVSPSTPIYDSSIFTALHSSSTCSHGDFFWNNHEIVIFSSLTQPIIVTFNTKSYYHTIWVIRHDKKEINKRLDKDKGNKDLDMKQTTKMNLLDNESLLNLSDSDDDDNKGNGNGNATQMLQSTLLHPIGDSDDSHHASQTSISSIRELLAQSGHHSASRRKNKNKTWRTSNTTNNKTMDTDSPIASLFGTLQSVPGLSPIGNPISPFGHTLGVKVSQYIEFPNLVNVSNAQQAENYDHKHDENDIGLFSELFVECCWKEQLGVLYEKVKSVYGVHVANSIDFNEKGSVFFGCDIFNNPLICIFRNKSQLIASYRLKCKSLDETFSGKCGVGVNNMISQTGSTSLNIELLFVWCGIKDIKPIRSLRSLSHCDDDDYHYYQFYSLHSHNNGINKGQNVSINNDGDNNNQISFESLFHCSGSQSHALLHQMQEMSSFDYDLLVLNDFTKTLSIYSANYRLCDIVLPQALNISMIVSLNDAVNNRVSLTCGNGEQYRVIIPRWDKNIRVIAVLKCFQLFLTPDLMHCIRILLIEIHNINNGSLWFELCQIILYFIMITDNDNDNAKSRSSTYCNSRNTTSNHEDAWQRLQQSDFHQHMTQTEPSLSKLKTIRNDNMQNKCECECFVDVNIEKQLEIILNKFDKLSLDESNDKSKWDTPNQYMDIKYILSQINDECRFNMLLSIHLLYENCKLSILLKSHLEPLVLLLSKISLSMSMYSYFDHYCRDFGHIIIPELSKYRISAHLLSIQECYNDKNIAPVPSIYDTIMECMRGNRKVLDEFPLPSYSLLFDLSSVLSADCGNKHKRNVNGKKGKSPFYTGSSIFSPLLGPYSLLRKVCYFYDILSKKNAPQQCSSIPRISSRYSLQNANADHSNMYATPLQINKTFLDNAYITPYTPSSIKKTKNRIQMMSPCTPFTRHTSSRYQRDHNNNISSKMSVDSSIHRNNISMTSFRHDSFEAYPFFSPSFLIRQETVYDATNRAEELTLAMVEENFTLSDIDCLPLGIALPLREALRSCKYAPRHNWPKMAYLLIGREDLANKGNVNVDDDSQNEDELQQEKADENICCAASPLGRFSSMRSSATFVDRDKYKYEFGPNKDNRGYSGKRYSVKKLLRNIGAPSPKLCAVNDINAMHKSTDNIRSATATLASLCLYNRTSSMVKKTRQRLMNEFEIDSFFDCELMAKPDYDGTLTVLDECLLQFGSDYRLKEVRRILRSDKTRRIRGISSLNIGNMKENMAAYHINLFHLVKRRLAQCVARGMFTVWSYRPSATSPIDIPPLNLSGIVPSRNLKLDLDFSVIQNAVTGGDGDGDAHAHLSKFDSIIFNEYEEVDASLFLQWIEFHNGCSAGLRVLTNYDCSRENIRTWICYNKPTTPSYAHSGFIFAQGLNGHLDCLMPADFYWYLGHKHEATTMAIILGLSIARRATMDTYVHKMCCLHIASMVPGGFAELGIETTVQASALLGVGFLFMGTKHKLSTDMLLVEIVRRSSCGNLSKNGGMDGGEENIEDRECYSLCAGIALGLIHLGVADDDHLENRLEQLMGGTGRGAGHGKRCKMLHYLYDIFNARTSASSNYSGSSQAISKYGITTGIPGGAGANSQCTITGLSVFATSNIINPSIEHTNTNNSESLVSGQNHLRAAIHYFMPNFSDFPDINDDYQNQNDDELNGNSRIRDGQWVNTNMTAPGAILAFGLMYLKTNNESAAQRLIIPTKPYLLDYIEPEWIFLKVVCKCVILWDTIHYSASYFMAQIPTFIANNFQYHDILKLFPSNYNDKKAINNKLDNHAITLAFINIMTGTCFAIGLKYAGTHDSDASRVISKYLLQFMSCRKTSSLLNVDRYTIEASLGMCAISLSLIQCGSGDLATFRVFRELRMCLDADLTYGHHQLYSMCIGFLFLGGGKLTLGHSKLAIAALLISCYPRFPIHSLDNQFHLQILRHLYVLAIEKRHINTIDIDTNLPIRVAIQVELLNKESTKTIIHKRTPCLLPDYNQICSIKINCAEFWDISFTNLQINCSAWNQIVKRGGIIYLKRKSGHLNLSNESQYQSQYHSALFDNNVKKQSDLVCAFGADADPNILEFAKQFCSPFTKMAKFCGYALYQCLSNAKPEMISTYLKLYHACEMQNNYNDDNLMVKNVKLLATYYDYGFGADWQIKDECALIEKEFVAKLKNKFESFYRKVFEDDNKILLEYIKSGWNLQMNINERKLVQILAAFLSYSEMNKSLIIKNALKSLKQRMRISTNNIDYILNEKNEKENKKKLFILPLLNLAINAEMQEIKTRFGYNNELQETPKINRNTRNTISFETPKHFKNRNKNMKQPFPCLQSLPKSFGFSVLTNVLTK